MALNGIADQVANWTPDSVKDYLTGAGDLKAVIAEALTADPDGPRRIDRAEFERIVHGYRQVEGSFAFLRGTSSVERYVDQHKPALLSGIRAAQRGVADPYMNFMEAQLRFDRTHQSAVRTNSPFAGLEVGSLQWARAIIKDMLTRGAGVAQDTNAAGDAVERVIGTAYSAEGISDADFEKLHQAAQDPSVRVLLFKRLSSINQQMLTYFDNTTSPSKEGLAEFIKSHPEF